MTAPAPEGIELVEMGPDRLSAWSRRLWEVYRRELVEAGVSEAAADRDVRETMERTMPGGVLAEGNVVLDVVHGGRPVGVVWLVHRPPDWHIYDLEIEPEMRRRGLGRATLRGIEAFVRGRGGRAINLSVFGSNATARALYESEGYRTVRLAMQKPLVGTGRGASAAESRDDERDAEGGERERRDVEEPLEGPTG